MWEAIGDVLTSANAGVVMASLLILVVVISVLSRRGILSINTKGLTLGADVKERDIIRQQVEWTHTFITGLKVFLPDSQEHSGYFAKYILECVYSEVVDWITFNHITIDSDYISIKQAKIKALVYSFEVRPEYRTPKFEKQIDAWVDEVIRKLVLIREVYK